MAVKVGSANVAQNTEHIEQLMLLRAVTARTGILHEAQVRQLKLWPLLVFQESKSATCKPNVEKKSIVFDVTNGPKPFKPGRNERRIEPREAPVMLSNWVKQLLGEDWAVTINVKTNGKTKSYSFAAKKVERESVEELCKRLAKEDAEAKKQ
jgi:hypothetical protein